MINKWGSKLTERLFTTTEINYCLKRTNSAECFAARFAAKEAFAKAVGHGWCKHLSWIDIEVVNANTGKPDLVVEGKTKQLLRNKRVALSISHTRVYAVAVVTVEDET